MILKSFISDKLFCRKFYADCGIFFAFLFVQTKKRFIFALAKEKCSFTRCENSSVGRARSCPGIINSDLGKIAFQKSKCIKCENSSVGRARPCQGRGRGFESRFSLSLQRCSNGGTGRHAGLKILWPLRLCGFKSRFEYS